ncbi:MULTISPECIES: hypothetical protein [Methylobacterium]|jgi:hypothetical protein|uniref:Uncharacterized protein n=1 Tax=Methylobacterium longum TaxID=767694 RepID=A0ABT8AVN4_9HYPH|nr:MULTISPECIES: hypothetical protein [Methylobacterium]MCJ2100208.1 hypothetical protein [Methylobacterium sp. E-046]MDN3573485.1 hypothetical protein [Methylobacterium longum]GJE14650.1 hypothetical protein FOHLNKBM_5725 [Methylobacterium longum]
MNRLVLVLVLAALATAAAAQERVATRTLSCAALQARVARDGHVVLATSETAYETVHLDAGACRNDETAAPAFAPAADAPSCLTGWRCRQRNSDSGQR